MERHVFPRAARAAARLALAAATLGAAGLVHAQGAVQPDTPPVDPSFSAYSLKQICSKKTDTAAQSQCFGAVRGIIHGYQYGVLFLGQRSSVPSTEIQRVSLCLHGTSVSSIVDEFVSDASQVKDDALQRTPAEVALLGSVHTHHACN